MAEFKFGAVSMFELGDFIRKRLIEDGVESEATLIVKVPKDKFLKVDEDLFYRTKKDGDVYVPSEDEIVARFSDNLRIVIQIENEKH